MRYSICDRFLHKLAKITTPFFSNYRRNKLNNTDFTIISNNCWAGNVYRHYGLPYSTPTVGLYFFAEDYIKFVYGLEYYLSHEIQFIDIKKSKNYKSLKQNGNINIPIGKIDDVEVIFLHYKTQEEAKEKWIRRCKRVNFNNIIIKFSEMNNCKQEHIEIFERIPCKKFVFVKNAETTYKSAIYYKGWENQNQIYDDVFFWNKYIKIDNLINAGQTPYKGFSFDSQ